MSVTSILNNANSGLIAAQVQLRVVSDNVANVNTPGYVRKIADQVAMSSQGVGSGVEVVRIRLATDRFLQAASLTAGAESARNEVRYELYDRIQSLFGDPGGKTSFFAQVDGIFSAFASSAEDPTSSPRRQDALFKTQALFDEASRIAKQIQAVREDADGRIQSAVDKTNNLLAQIEALNVEITRAKVVNGDASGAETAQAALIDQVAQLMDIRITARPVGGVTIRTSAGAMLAGEGAATLSYTRAGTISGETNFNEIWINEPGGTKHALLDSVTSGEIKGLVELRDVEAPAAAARLAELITHVADELNRAHNANTAMPAPNRLDGRNVGQSLESALTGFTGRTTIAVTNPAGVIQQRVDVVFNGATMTVNGVAADPTTFLATLNAQLGGAATATFTDGKLSIAAANSANGVAIADDATAPSNKAGRGFSHYFGLNDLIATDRPALYDTGLTLASPHGFTAGQTMTFRFSNDVGARIRDIKVTVPPGGTVADLINALNDPATGIGGQGSFALAADGTLSFTGSGNPPAKMSVLNDTTQNAANISATELFGIGAGVRISRADGFSLRSDIRQSPAKLALGQLNLSAAAGTPALSAGDGRGALALADAGERTTSFQPAGGSPGGSISVSRYASELAGEIGGNATTAKNRKESSAALYTEATARRTSHEGVNMDEELVLMTTYQQAFNASARLIQTARDMYDTLLGMV
ncbi:MAG: flagellar hook-associated protein FlgK [Brevundimonas sp.]|nr:flagellar hook-associated protein FlgK [Brevundimonas sp.]